MGRGTVPAACESPRHLWTRGLLNSHCPPRIERFSMAGRNFLFVPGPTNVPDRVLRAMHRAMEDHRSSDFPALAAPVLEDLKKNFQDSLRPAVHLSGQWHRRLGGVALQYALPR